jgi:hypothetical protein
MEATFVEELRRLAREAAATLSSKYGIVAKDNEAETAAEELLKIWRAAAEAQWAVEDKGTR